VNDTFTALTCLDWISSGLSRISGRDFSERVYRDDEGRIRLIAQTGPTQKWSTVHSTRYAAARGMPGVIIRMLDSLNAVVDATTTASQREVLLRQGEMIVEGSQDSVNDQNDLNDILWHFNRLAESIEERIVERDVMSQRQQRHLLRRCPMIPAEPNHMDWLEPSNSRSRLSQPKSIVGPVSECPSLTTLVMRSMDPTGR